MAEVLSIDVDEHINEVYAHLEVAQLTLANVLRHMQGGTEGSTEEKLQAVYDQVKVALSTLDSIPTT